MLRTVDFDICVATLSRSLWHD